MFKYSVYTNMTPELAAKLARAKGIYLTKEGKKKLEELLKDKKK